MVYEDEVTMCDIEVYEVNFVVDNNISTNLFLLYKMVLIIARLYVMERFAIQKYLKDHLQKSC